MENIKNTLQENSDITFRRLLVKMLKLQIIQEELVMFENSPNVAAYVNTGAYFYSCIEGEIKVELSIADKRNKAEQSNIIKLKPRDESKKIIEILSQTVQSKSSFAIEKTLNKKDEESKSIMKKRKSSLEKSLEEAKKRQELKDFDNLVDMNNSIPQKQSILPEKQLDDVEMQDQNDEVGIQKHQSDKTELVDQIQNLSPIKSSYPEPETLVKPKDNNIIESIQSQENKAALEAPQLSMLQKPSENLSTALSDLSYNDLTDYELFELQSRLNMIRST